MPTISEQLTQLISDRDDLVDNLTTKGITGLTGDETFTKLVPEVLNIPSGGTSVPDWSEIGYNEAPQSVLNDFNYSKNIYDNWDSSITNLYNKFFQDDELKYFPLVDTSNVTNMSRLFYYCTELTEVPLLDTSNVTDMSNMFNNCRHIKYISALDTVNVTNMANMFQDCIKITSIPRLNAGNATRVSFIFRNCQTLINFGGLLNLGQAYLTTQSANFGNYKLDLSECPNLTHDSLINVINGLYDIATKGCNVQQLVIGSTNLAKLTAEEIAIATNKGWTVS